MECKSFKGNGPHPPVTRWNTLKNGLMTLPSVTNALILAVKSLVTREYLETLYLLMFQGIYKEQ
jgi:hypothetical protein